MRAIVGMMNGDRIAVATDSGDFSVFEVIGGHTTDLEDEMTGPFHSLGNQMVINTTKNERLRAFIDDFGMDEQTARQWLIG